MLTIPEYIEREALIARLQKVCVADDVFSIGIQFGTGNAINCIKEAPTADVVEVKHGEWEKHTNSHLYWYECSICGDYPPRNSYGHEYHSAYCPNCGANMDGKRKEEKND